MKVKNVNVVEKHLEKLVVLLCLLGLGYSIWAYAVSNPFTVAVDGRPIDVGEVDQEVLTAAQRLEGEIKKPAHSELTQLRPPDYPQQFTERFTSSLAPQIDAYNALAFSENPNILGKTRVDTSRNPTYHVPQVPAPDDVQVACGLGTVEPTGSNPPLTAQTHPQTMALLSPAPYDLQWISLSCQFDAKALRESLSVVPSDPNINKIPMEWWRTTLAMVDVEMQRQVRQPDGSWAEPQTIEALPDSIKGQFRQATGQVALDIAPDMISSLMKYQLPIMQPAFYPLLNQQWIPPSEQKEAGPVQPQDPFGNDPTIRTLRQQITTVTKRFETLQNQINRLGQLGRPVPELLQRRLRESQTKLQELNNQLRERMLQLEKAADARTATTTETTTEERPAVGVAGGLLSGELIQLWAHDVRVDEGKTYRYRVRVHVVNPLYSRRMDEKQAEQYAQLFKIASEWSAWSEPVETNRLRYSFVKTGRESTNSIEVEVWRFTNAQWYSAVFSVTPGDVIGGPTIKYQSLFDPQAVVPAEPVDFNTGQTVVDIDFDYPIQVGNITRPTVRLLYADAEQQLNFIQKSEDTKQIDALREKLRQHIAASETTTTRPRPTIPDRVPGMQPPSGDPYERYTPPPGGGMRPPIGDPYSGAGRPTPGGRLQPPYGDPYDQYPRGTQRRR